MRAKRWVIFIGLNIVVSILTTLGVLSLKGEIERVVIVTVTPNAAPVAQPEAVSVVPVGEATQPVATPTVPTSIEYRIQPGDTLGGIALYFDIALNDLLEANGLTENDIINPGQLLTIPVGEILTPTPSTPSPIPATPTPDTPTAIPTDTPTPPGPVLVRIEEVLAPGNLAREAVVLVNRGRTVNLAGWKLQSAGGNVSFEFPRLTLAQEVPVTVYTIGGSNTPQELHWGLDEAQWGTSDTVIELRDAEGDLVATYALP
jgi:LysM repeat protein